MAAARAAVSQFGQGAPGGQFAPPKTPAFIRGRNTGAGRLGFIATHNLQPNYYNTLLQQVAATSPAQLRAMIQKELDPNHEVIVLLGDRKSLDKAFADAGIKDVKIVEPDYK